MPRKQQAGWQVQGQPWSKEAELEKTGKEQMATWEVASHANRLSGAGLTVALNSLGLRGIVRGVTPLVLFV